MGYKLIDLTGQRFGRLYVMRRGEDYLLTSPYEKTIKRIPQWLCACDCGNIALVAGSSLRSGKTKSCGCLRRDKSVEAANAIGDRRTGRRPKQKRAKKS